MAEPVPFRDSNVTLQPPPGTGMLELPVLTDGETCISKWMLTSEEIEEIARTGHIFVLVHTGHPTQPPVGLSAEPPYIIHGYGS